MYRRGSQILRGQICPADEERDKHMNTIGKVTSGRKSQGTRTMEMIMGAIIVLGDSTKIII